MDKELYVNVVKKIIANAGDINPLDDVVREYIDKWYAAKEPWIKRFGDSTSVMYPEKLTFYMDEETCKARIRGFLDTILVKEWCVPRDSYTFGYSKFAEFVEEQGVGAAENIVSKSFLLPDGTTIVGGTKLLRAFKYFFNCKESLTYAQDLMNNIISDCKFTGYFHISVDPLDYLSVSENSYGWRSCHSLDGDYAAGNLEYMMDSSTLVCYIDDNSKTTIRNFPTDVPWNSKQWRMLLFSSDDGNTVFAGRQYPKTLNQIFPVIDKMWNQLFPKHNNLPWVDNNHINHWDNRYLPMGQDIDCIPEAGDKEAPILLWEPHIVSYTDNRIYPLSVLYQEVNKQGPLFYDDILRSTVYTKPYYNLRRCNVQERILHPIRVGVEEVRCPGCGEPFSRDVELDGLICPTCADDEGNFMTCDCCGRRHVRETEGSWLVDDSFWCEDCITDSAVICSGCGGLCNIELATFNEETGEYYCQYCQEDE